MCAAAQCCMQGTSGGRACQGSRSTSTHMLEACMCAFLYCSGAPAIDMALHVLRAGPWHATSAVLVLPLPCSAEPGPPVRASQRLLQNGSQKEGQASRKRLSPAPRGKTEGGPRELSTSCNSVYDARTACILAHYHKPEISRSRNLCT